MTEPTPYEKARAEAGYAVPGINCGTPARRRATRLERYRDVEPHADDLLSVGEAAIVADVSIGTILNWTNLGKVPSRRTPGGHRRIRLGDLEAVLQ